MLSFYLEEYVGWVLKWIVPVKMDWVVRLDILKSVFYIYLTICTLIDQHEWYTILVINLFEANLKARLQFLCDLKNKVLHLIKLKPRSNKKSWLLDHWKVQRMAPLKLVVSWTELEHRSYW